MTTMYMEQYVTSKRKALRGIYFTCDKDFHNKLICVLICGYGSINLQLWAWNHNASLKLRKTKVKG